MNPADLDDLREGLAAWSLSQAMDRQGLTPEDDADGLISGPLVPLIAKAESADRLAAEVEVLRAALKAERAQRRAAVQSVRGQAVALCESAAAYFDRTTGHYDRTQAARSYRHTAGAIQMLRPSRAALAADKADSADATHTAALARRG